MCRSACTVDAVASLPSLAARSKFNLTVKIALTPHVQPFALERTQKGEQQRMTGHHAPLPAPGRTLSSYKSEAPLASRIPPSALVQYHSPAPSNSCSSHPCDLDFDLNKQTMSINFAISFTFGGDSDAEGGPYNPFTTGSSPVSLPEDSALVQMPGGWQVESRATNGASATQVTGREIVKFERVGRASDDRSSDPVKKAS
jgi:hypothetical protein